MDKYISVIKSLFQNNLDDLKSQADFIRHSNELKIVCETNLLEIKEGCTKKFFFKLYIHNNGGWEFFDYGWLDQNKFVTHKSKLTIFNIERIDLFVSLHNNSDKHIVIVNNGLTYLLYNPLPEVLQYYFFYLNNLFGNKK